MIRKLVGAGFACYLFSFAGVACSETVSTPPGAETAASEVKKALSLEPDINNGKRVYMVCSVCHGPEGWGRPDGSYPQIAGQLAPVIVKQLADIRARNRDNPIMFPFSKPRVLGGPQDIADVAAYIAGLPMTPRNSVGPGYDLKKGEALYEENCVDCHGARGEGDPKEHGPLIQGQHFLYLVRQFEWIRDGRRRNADQEMVKQIKRFTRADELAVLDYVSRLKPAAAKLAAPRWQNPDFPYYARPPMMPPPPLMPSMMPSMMPLPPQPPEPPEPPKRPY